MSVYVSIRQCMSVYISTCQFLSEYVSICQFISVDVSIEINLQCSPPVQGVHCQGHCMLLWEESPGFE